MELYYKEYLVASVLLWICMLLSVVILTLSMSVTINEPNVEKLSAYECGFEPYEDARNTFDIKFYLIAILFIIFDLETAFFLPWSVSISFINLNGIWIMIDFIIELLIGFGYAWYIGCLSWSSQKV